MEKLPVKKISQRELKFGTEGEIQESMREIFDDRRKSMSIPNLLDQIRVLENEKRNLKEENNKLKNLLHENGIKLKEDEDKEIQSPEKKKKDKGEKTVYDILGDDLIKKGIDLQYDLMIQHDDIGTQFHTMAYYCPDSMIKLKKHQFSFTVNLFGGKATYLGRNIKQAHRFKGIHNEDFDIWVDCVKQAYLQLGVDEQTVQRILELYSSLRDSIVIA